MNFSWAPFSNRKTVIRGGYDIFYSNAFALINAPGQGAANAPGWNQEFDWNGSWNPSQCAPHSGNCPAFQLSDTTTDKGSLTTPPLAHTFPAQQHAPLYGGLVQFFTPPRRDPMVQSWNLEIERELPGDLVVDIGYVGDHGTHLAGDTFHNYNFVHTSDRLKYKTAINSNIPITDVYSGQTAAMLQQIWGSPTLPRSILLTDYPAYGIVWAISAFDGASRYDGMNLRIQKRYSHGFEFIAAYTMSKKITNAAVANMASLLVDPIHWSRPSAIGGRIGAVGGLGAGGYENPDNRNIDRGIAADDITHMLNFAGSYDLPFGNGKALLNKGGALNGLFGGWRLTGNFNAQTGLPLAISGPCDEISCRPNLIGDPHFKGSRSKADRIQQWINPAVFEPAFGGDQSFWTNYDPTDPRAWLFGNAGPRIPGLRSPVFWNVDSALGKQFHLTDTRYFDFRWEVFNVLNHQNLGLPNTSFCLPPGPNGQTDKVHVQGCTFGRITDIQTDPRSMEFALKFFF